MRYSNTITAIILVKYYITLLAAGSPGSLALNNNVKSVEGPLKSRRHADGSAEDSSNGSPVVVRHRRALWKSFVNQITAAIRTFDVKPLLIEGTNQVDGYGNRFKNRFRITPKAANNVMFREGGDGDSGTGNDANVQERIKRIKKEVHELDKRSSTLMERCITVFNNIQGGSLVKKFNMGPDNVVPKYGDGINSMTDDSRKNTLLELDKLMKTRDDILYQEKALSDQLGDFIPKDQLDYLRERLSAIRSLNKDKLSDPNSKILSDKEILDELPEDVTGYLKSFQKQLGDLEKKTEILFKRQRKLERLVIEHPEKLKDKTAMLKEIEDIHAFRKEVIHDHKELIKLLRTDFPDKEIDDFKKRLADANDCVVAFTKILDQITRLVIKGGRKGFKTAVTDAQLKDIKKEVEELEEINKDVQVQMTKADEVTFNRNAIKYKDLKANEIESLRVLRNKRDKMIKRKKALEKRLGYNIPMRDLIDIEERLLSIGKPVICKSAELKRIMTSKKPIKKVSSTILRKEVEDLKKLTKIFYNQQVDFYEHIKKHSDLGSVNYDAVNNVLKEPLAGFKGDKKDMMDQMEMMKELRKDIIKRKKKLVAYRMKHMPEKNLIEINKGLSEIDDSLNDEFSKKFNKRFYSTRSKKSHANLYKDLEAQSPKSVQILKSLKKRMAEIESLYSQIVYQHWSEKDDRIKKLVKLKQALSDDLKDGVVPKLDLAVLRNRLDKIVLNDGSNIVTNSKIKKKNNNLHSQSVGASHVRDDVKIDLLEKEVEAIEKQVHKLLNLQKRSQKQSYINKAIIENTDKERANKVKAAEIEAAKRLRSMYDDILKRKNNLVMHLEDYSVPEEVREEMKECLKLINTIKDISDIPKVNEADKPKPLMNDKKLEDMYNKVDDIEELVTQLLQRQQQYAGKKINPDGAKTLSIDEKEQLQQMRQVYDDIIRRKTAVIDELEAYGSPVNILDDLKKRVEKINKMQNDIKSEDEVLGKKMKKGNSKLAIQIRKEVEQLEIETDLLFDREIELTKLDAKRETLKKEKKTIPPYNESEEMKEINSITKVRKDMVLRQEALSKQLSDDLFEKDELYNIRKRLEIIRSVNKEEKEIEEKIPFPTFPPEEVTTPVTEAVDIINDENYIAQMNRVKKAVSKTKRHVEDLEGLTGFLLVRKKQLMKRGLYVVPMNSDFETEGSDEIPDPDIPETIVEDLKDIEEFRAFRGGALKRVLKLRKKVIDNNDGIPDEKVKQFKKRLDLLRLELDEKIDQELEDAFNISPRLGRNKKLREKLDVKFVINETNVGPLVYDLDKLSDIILDRQMNLVKVLTDRRILMTDMSTYKEKSEEAPTLAQVLQKYQDIKRKVLKEIYVIKSTREIIKTRERALFEQLTKQDMPEDEKLKLEGKLNAIKQLNDEWLKHKDNPWEW